MGRPNRYTRTWSLGSRSYGSHQRRLRSNLTRGRRIKRPRSKGARAGGAATPATDSAAARLGARRSSTFPSLRRPNLHDFKPGSITAAQGIDLGLQLGLEGLGLRDPRLGVARGGGHRRRAAFQELGRVLGYDS
jgi:hypothetical protein